MPNAAPAAGAGVPVSGDHSNAMELASPVVEELDTPVGDPNAIGSHREDGDDNQETADDGEANPTADVPVRLKGKSLAEIYTEFSGLEKEYSRQGNELGEARGLLRQALEQSLKQPGTGQTQEEEPEPTDDEIIANPKDSFRRLVNKEVRPLREALQTAEQRQMVTEFNARHPGYQQEVRSPQFVDFVKASPYRVKLFTAAAKYDMDAAEDLFAAWDEHKASKPAGEGEQDPGQTKREAIKRATTVTGGAGKAAGTSSGKKIYKSTELTRLYQTDRERYNEMMPEIKKAFAEGRVR